MAPLRVCVWATTLGADLLTFTHFLDDQPAVELLVVAPDPDRFRREAIWQLRPLRARFIAPTPGLGLARAALFRPHVTVLDSRPPLLPISRRGFVLWHGFGWKGPNDRREFRALHTQLRLLWGDPLRPNPRFRWQCFGPWDFEHRTQVSGFHPANCRQLGAASHDALREPLDRRRVQDFYPFDVVSRPTVLIAPTWHYGEIFAHWGSDRELLGRLLARIASRGANTILRLHDSWRFDPAYVRLLRELAARHPRVLLKFKDQHPDNQIDLQVADCLVTNFSSIANLFYATGRPTVHVYPVRSADEAFAWRTVRLGRVTTASVANARFIWKLPPEENGGLLARSFDEVVGQVEQALDDPACCRERARQFVDRHMLGADGRNCERIWAALQELTASA